MQVQVVAHNPRWHSAFEVEGNRISRALGDIVVRLHHIGSTAIPGIFAKPIIDILLEVTDVAELDARSSVMEALGYEVIGEFGLPGRRYFRKDDTRGLRTHQVHAFQGSNSEIQRHLAFRDYMIAHPAEAQEYSDLKRKLLREHPGDIEAYMDGKEPFIKDREARASAWWRARSPERGISILHLIKLTAYFHAGSDVVAIAW